MPERRTPTTPLKPARALQRRGRSRFGALDKQQGRSGRSPLHIAAAACVVVVAAILLTTQFAGSGSTNRMAPQSLMGATLEEEGARLGHVPLPYSVELASYSDVAKANAQLKMRRTDAAHMLLFVSPEWVHGTLEYKLMAGMLQDRSAAAMLLQNLVAAGLVNSDSGPAPTDRMRHTPLTYDVGAYPSEKAARMTASLLGLHGIPSYPVAMSNVDGSESWRLFVGAFPNSNAAAGVRLLIGKAKLTKLTPKLSARTGRQPRMIQ